MTPQRGVTRARRRPISNISAPCAACRGRWRLNAARSLLDSGAVIGGASDWPVSTANPFAAMYQAETRSGPQGVLDATQRMPREAMLFAYTRNSAQVLNQFDQIGSLAPGKLADLVLVDRDVLTVPAEELKDVAVVWTMLGGKIVYGKVPYGGRRSPFVPPFADPNLNRPQIYYGMDCTHVETGVGIISLGHADCS